MKHQPADAAEAADLRLHVLQTAVQAAKDVIAISADAIRCFMESAVPAVRRKVFHN